ncbi:MAG: glycosyltransferase family 39 protein, partial [Nitrospinota bacterium]
MVVILIMGLLITVFVVPREHRLYYDEDIYQNIGQNIAYLKSRDINSQEGYWKTIKNSWKRFIGHAAMCNEGKIEYGEYQCFRLEYNKQPNSWPYLISVVFRLVGVNEQASFITNNFIYGLSVLTVFFIGYLLFKDAFTGIYAALIFSLIPELMMWSNTTAVEPGAALFAGLTLLGFLIYLQSRELKSLYLAAVTAAFAAQFRMDSIMILGVAGLAMLLWDRERLKKGDFYLLLSIFFILIIPHLVHI